MGVYNLLTKNYRENRREWTIKKTIFFRHKGHKAPNWMCPAHVADRKNERRPQKTHEMWNFKITAIK